MELYGHTLKYLDILFTDKMEDYISNINNRLRRGEHREIIGELRELINFHKLFERHDDPVLLTKLAEAEMRAGDFDAALQHFHDATKEDKRPKNVAIAYAGIGRVYMGKKEFQNAINAFQESYKQGGAVSVLVLQAIAHLKLGQYSESIESYAAVLKSGKDERPFATKVGIAKAYWEKFNHYGAVEDIENTLYFIEEVIKEYPYEQMSYDLLVKMALVNIPNALKCLLSHLENSRILATACLLNELTFKNFFLKDVMYACINRFASVTPSETDYQPFVRSITDYSMKATIYFYFFSKENEDYLKLIDQIFTVILKHQDACSLISEYLCSSRGAYIEYLDSIAVRSVMDKTDKLQVPDDSIEKESYIKTTVIPTIRNMLLYPISFCPNVHYTGHDNYIFPSWKERIERCLENISIEWFNIENKHVPLSLSWYFTENFLKWFLKIHDDSKYLSFSDYKITANITGLDKSIRIILSTKYSVNPLEDIDNSLGTIFNSNTCPIPNNIYGFSYSVDFSQISAGEISATLHIVIGTKVEIVGLPSEFWSFMDSTFNFNKNSTEVINRNEFYNRAKCYFSNCEISSKEQWIDFVLGFIDHHFSLAYLSFLKDEEYHTALHDCKRIADSIMLNNPLPENTLKVFLEKISELPAVMKGIRARYILKNLRDVETKKIIEMDEIIMAIIEEEEKLNTGANFVTTFEQRGVLVMLDETSFKLALANLIHNAHLAALAVNTEKTVFVNMIKNMEELVIIIDNPYLTHTNDTSDRLKISTGYGIPTSKKIIEHLHNGKMEGPYKDKPKPGFYRVSIYLPLQSK